MHAAVLALTKKEPATSTVEPRWLKFEQQTLERAERGETSAALRALHLLRDRLEGPAARGDEVMRYARDCLDKVLDHDIGIEKAFGLDADPSAGGRPRKYDSLEVAAADLILRDHCGFKPEQACAWVSSEIGMDRAQLQRLRRTFDNRYTDAAIEAAPQNLSLEDLLHTAGSLSAKLVRVLQQS